MGKIKIMNNNLINKIAAGEVVEKCSSVVKELVENSIDANSTKIKIELKESGTNMIRVIDNGIGMDAHDAETAFLRHATSKLLDEDDLYRIATLGFRGEALPSIAAVSVIDLKTSVGKLGIILKLKEGKVVKKEKGDSRKGTSITVNNLFYNTPARLKHLSSLYTELANITEFVNKMALSHPEISFELYNDGKKLLITDGSNNILKVINAIYGIDVSSKMLEVKGINDDYEIYGYISKPEVTRSNRNHIVTIVNGRVIKNVEINRAINDSYHTYKPEDRYPIVCLVINVDSSLIDVNIHPSKMDIKFSKKEELKTLINNVISKVLLSINLVPNIEAREQEIFYDEFKLDIDTEVKEDIVVDVGSFNSEEIIETFENTKERMPMMYPVGSVLGTYIICHNDEGMFLIDQHAAKERINYEIYLKKLGDPSDKIIDLLIPINFEYSNDEFIILQENFENIRKLGFVIEVFGVNSIIVKAHPIWLPMGHEKEAIQKLFEVVLMKEDNFSTEKFNEKVAINVSCKLSIKGNTDISLKEMEALISDLRKTENPFTCPHGRPTVISYSIYELEKMFKRVM